MKLPYRAVLAGAVTILLSLCLAAGGFAAPTSVSRDRSDNSYSFTYDAASGEIGEATSGLRISRDDPVAFVIYIRENAGAQLGERLKAQLRLGLNKKQIMRYGGLFSFEVTDTTGTVIYRDEVSKRIVLRPRPGERNARFTLLFDLPSGSYSVRAYFKRP